MQEIKITMSYSRLGKQRLKPSCQKSQYFADIANTKYLSPSTLKLVKSLGYSLSIIPPKVKGL